MANFFKEVISPYGKYANYAVELDNIAQGLMPQGMGMPSVPSLDQLRRSYLFTKLFKNDYNKLLESEENNENNGVSGYQSQVVPTQQQSYARLEDLLRRIF